MSLQGANMEKSKTSHCVVNIVPPRSTWNQIQVYRNKNTKDARCGPHFSFIDPFVTFENYPEAARLLTEQLADFPPFKVILDKFGAFHFGKSSVLYLEPEFDPPNALNKLLKKIEEIFPQCNDQVLKSKTGVFVPHMTIGTYKNKAEVDRAIVEIKKDYIPITFSVTEIYMLHRIGTDPFEVSHVIPLHGKHTPHFGSACEDELLDTRANKSIVVLGIPNTLDNSDLAKAIAALGFHVVGAEMILNPNLSTRPIGVVEFHTRNDADRAIEAIKNINSNSNPNSLPATTYAKLLTRMAFPDVVGGTCSKR